MTNSTFGKFRFSLICCIICLSLTEKILSTDTFIFVCGVICLKYNVNKLQELTAYYRLRYKYSLVHLYGNGLNTSWMQNVNLGEQLSKNFNFDCWSVIIIIIIIIMKRVRL